MKKRLTFLLLLLILTLNSVLSFANPLDWGAITCTEAYRTELESLNTYRYYDGLNRPVYGFDSLARDLRAPLNRETLSLYATRFHMAALLENVPYGETKWEFKDYTNNYNNIVKRGSMLGVVTGFKDNTFRPLEKVSKEFAADTIYRTINKANATYTMSAKTISDAASINQTYLKQVQFLVDADVLTLDSAGNFNPKAGLSQEEFLLIIKRTIDYSDMEIFNYKKEYFENSVASNLTIKDLKKLKKGEFFFHNPYQFFMFIDRVYEDAKGTIPRHITLSGDLDYYAGEAYLHSDHNSYSFSIGGDKLSYSEYDVKHMRMILNDLSMLISNAYGENHPNYTKVMQSVLDVLDGKETDRFQLDATIDGHLIRKLYFEVGSSKNIAIRITENQAPLEEIESYSEIVAFDDAYTSFQALDIDYEDLETDIQKYPEILNALRSNTGYEFSPKYLNSFSYDTTDRYGDVHLLSLSLREYDNIVEHQLLLGFNLSSGQNLQFGHFSNKDVVKALNQASAYVYAISTPEAHKEIMTNVMDKMALMQLTPKEIKSKDLSSKDIDLSKTFITEKISIDESQLLEGTELKQFDWSPTPIRQFIYLRIRDSHMRPELTLQDNKNSAPKKTAPSDVKTKINDQLINTYVIEDDIYMLVEDLKYFGYDIQQHPYVAKISIQARTNNMSPITNASGPLMGQYVDSNYKVTFNNQLLDCYDIDGKPAFKVTYLTSVNATITWDGTNRELLINFPN